MQRVARALFFLAVVGAGTVQAADWRVYQAGPALELAVDADSIVRDAEGWTVFVNQERFTEMRRDEALKIRYRIRRTEGRADCTGYRYLFLSASYFSGSGQPVYSQMFPLQRYKWTWQPVYEGSVADAMMRTVCTLARNAPSKKK